MSTIYTQDVTLSPFNLNQLSHTSGENVKNVNENVKRICIIFHLLCTFIYIMKPISNGYSSFQKENKNPCVILFSIQKRGRYVV